MRPSQEILSFLQQAGKENKEIRLINVYKCFPISYPARILGVSNNVIKVKTEMFQIVCLYLEKETYIQGEMLPATVKAMVKAIDFINLEATLSTFKYVVGGIGDRSQVRVEPKEPLEGVVQSKERNIAVRGELADISLDGLAIYLEPELFSPRIYHKDLEVLVHLKLPLPKQPLTTSRNNLDSLSSRPEARPRYDNLRSRPAPTPYEEYPPIYGRESTLPSECVLSGTIVNIHQETLYKRWRLGIRLNPSDSSRRIISNFILQRQTEIVREIRNLYQTLASLESRK